MVHICMANIRRYVFICLWQNNRLQPRALAVGRGCLGAFGAGLYFLPPLGGGTGTGVFTTFCNVLLMTPFAVLIQGLCEGCWMCGKKYRYKRTYHRGLRFYRACIWEASVVKCRCIGRLKHIRGVWDSSLLVLLSIVGVARMEMCTGWWWFQTSIKKATAQWLAQVLKIIELKSKLAKSA